MKTSSHFRTRHPSRSHSEGFTLVAVILSMVVISIAAMSVISLTSTVVKRERETEFTYRIEAIRAAITKYRKDTGHHPSTLEDMLKLKYFRPVCINDPITGGEWELVYSSLSEGYGIKDIKSKSQDKAMRLKNGKEASYKDF